MRGGTRVRTAFITALREERAAVRKGWGLSFAGTLHGLELDVGADSVLFCCGMGAERVAQATRQAASLYNPLNFVLVGYSVALSSELQVGDLFWDERSAESWGRLLTQGELPFHTGRVATCGFLRTVQQKMAFAADHPDALVADLETEAFLSAVPSSANRVVLRAVSDEIQTELPLDFGSHVTERGFPDTFSIGKALLLRPWLVPQVVRLGLDASRANTSLTQALRFFQSALEGEQ